MNLIDALELLKQPLTKDAPLLQGFLACGFSPFHLQVFLSAHLRKRLPLHQIEIKTGLFGDLAGNIERLQGSACDVIAVVIEWQDLDPRLGIRSLGGWRITDLPDILNSAGQAAARLEKALRQASVSTPTSVCMPTLPLPPLFATELAQADGYELQLRELAGSFAASISLKPNIRIVNTQRLDELSPMPKRLDVQCDLIDGFPYELPHASTIAELLTPLLQPSSPKKGLITDLDGTVWAGILGEVGTEGISWNLEQRTHIHGLYQKFLVSLASTGVLIAVASKNDAAAVNKAFERRDMILSKSNVFPIEANWARKSESVERILKTWNIGPEDAVFIDDSPMEVAEVNTAFPEMECIVFPQSDSRAIWNLLRRLRDLYGKRTVSEEDSIRMMSIRAQASQEKSLEATDVSYEDFLRNADPSLTISFTKQPEDSRSFELINKTNQFNLNGKRLSEKAWIDYIKNPATFLMTLSYEDKYGPLGKIAVVLGRKEVNMLRVDTWVMSCRAFSRRVEHQALKQLFLRFDVEEIYFDYQATQRNEPLREFFSEMVGVAPTTNLHLSKAAYLKKLPTLFHRIEEA